MDESELAVRFTKEVMPLYIDSARAFAQLSAGALALTIAFKEKVLGEIGRMRINVLLITSWLCFLVAIGASAYYQWVAVRLIEQSLHDLAGDETLHFPLTVAWMWPGYAYGVMVIFFFVGSLLLILACASQLLLGKSSKTG